MRSSLQVTSIIGILTLMTSPVMLLPTAGEDGQWYFAALEIEKIHQSVQGRGVTVAVIDTGVDPKHPSLAGRVLSGADFTGEDAISTGSGRVDLNGHGTGMASLIAGTGTVRGIAPATKILPVRVKVDEGPVSTGVSVAVSRGIRWAVDHGANVINISLASPLADPRERSAVEYALRQGVVVVAGAGNTDHANSV